MDHSQKEAPAAILTEGDADVHVASGVPSASAPAVPQMPPANSSMSTSPAITAAASFPGTDIVTMSQVEDTHGYDLVYAITEKAVNSVMVTLWASTDKDGNPLIPDKWEATDDDSGATMSADLLPPTVSFNSLQSAANVVDFLINISGGTLEWPTVTRNKETKKLEIVTKSADLSQWVVTLPVSMDLVKFEEDKTGKVPEFIRKQLHSFTDDMFSIQSLFLNFTDADQITSGFTLKNSTLSKSDEDSASFNDFFIGFLKAFVKQHQGADNPFLLGHVAIKPSLENDATFQPTGVTYSVFKNAQNPDLSCLNYLLMIDNKPFPQTGSRGLFNFPFVSTDLVQGAFAVNSDLILTRVSGFVADVFKDSSGQPIAKFQLSSKDTPNKYFAPTFKYQGTDTSGGDYDVDTTVTNAVAKAPPYTAQIVVHTKVSKRVSGISLGPFGDLGDFTLWREWDDIITYRQNETKPLGDEKSGLTESVITATCETGQNDTGLQCSANVLDKIIGFFRNFGSDPLKALENAFHGKTLNDTIRLPTTDNGLFSSFSDKIILPGQDNILFKNPRFSGASGYLMLDTSVRAL